MKKILRLSTTLIVLLFLGGNAWGQTEIFNHAGGGDAPTGWSFTNNITARPIDQGSYWLVDAGNPSDIITTVSYDLSSYSTAVFNVDVASYGSGAYNPAKVEISYDGGSNFTQNETTAITTGSSYITGGPINLNSVSSQVVIKISNNGTTGRGVRLQNLVLTATASSSPTISISPTTLTGFTYELGSGPSAEQTFTVEGSNLTHDITITPPTNYEISTGTGGSFVATNPITLSQSSGTVSSTTIYVRLIAGLAVGDYNGEEITATSTDATDKTVTCSGSVTAPPAPDVPVATAATAVGSNGFTANWNASAGATGYFLDVYHAGGSSVATDLIISEYIEGSSSEKYIEVFNGTGSSVDLSNYKLQLYTNGSPTATSDVTLSGTLVNGSVIVYKNSSANLYPAGINNASVNFNGDDAVALYKISTSSFVDIFGRIGEDPGTEWGSSPLWTINTTLVRKSSITGGVTTNPGSGFPTLSTEWDNYATDVITYLGSHTLGSGAVYDLTNESVGNVASYAVTSLSPGTTYYYVVRATNANGTSANSNEIEVTTTGGVTAPTITSPTATSITDVSATLGGNITSDGGSSITERGTVWKTSAGVTITDNKLAEGGTSTGVFSHSRTSLPVGSQIFYRAYATNAIGTTLSDESSFYTLATEPTAHPTGFGATANSSSAITVNWTDATPAADGYLIKGSNVSYGDIAVPVDGTAETNSLLVQNVASGFGTFQFTGLAASTHYFFKIYPYNGSAASINYKTNGTIEEATATTSAYVGPNIWVNEIHYDNDGTDANEFIEVVLENPGSYALSDFAVYLVNGSNGEIYDTKTLDEFTVGTSYGDFTFYSYTYPENGIQNGASDGMAISYQGNLISGQFLSYEGSILGSGGAVDGITSVDIGVSEDGFTPVGYSLQLAGVGTVYSDFVWMAPATNTQGVINNQQSFYAATVWNGSIDTDWGTAGNWSNGIPVLASEVTIPAVTNLPVLSITGSAGDLTIESSAGLTIQTNGSLTVSGTFTNNAGTSGLLLKSDASGTGSLIHSTAGVNASVQRYLSGGWSGWDAGWHQISSPVAAQSISAFATTGAGNGYDLYGWEESTNMWMNYKAAGFEAWNGNSTNFNVGQGYLVSYEAASITQTFTGELNATDETRANLTTNGGSYNGWNLLGNPFASALKWNDGNWTLNNVAGVAKVWSEAGKSYSDIEASTGIIPSAQGFMVQVSSTTSLTIPAVSRVHDATPFFKSGNEKLVLVAAETEGGSAQESKIIVNPMATEGFDFDYDSRFLAGYAPMLYSIVGDESLSTNSLPELATGKVIPLGFVKNAATTFTIELKESIPAHAVYLTDKKTDIVTNLSENPVYSFTSSEGDDPNRFELKFGAVGIDDNIGLEQTSIYSHGQSVFVSSAKSAQAVISIYNITGQQVYANTMVIDGQKQIALNTPTGWYIVKVTTAAGVATQKVFIKSN